MQQVWPGRAGTTDAFLNLNLAWRGADVPKPGHLVSGWVLDVFTKLSQASHVDLASLRSTERHIDYHVASIIVIF